MAHVLMLHSGGFSSRQWRKLVAELSPEYQVLAPDLLGYGEQPAWPAGEPFHFRQDLEFVESLVAPLGEPVHVVGHSYGGFLALKLALARPESVRSLALYEPVAFGILDEAEDAESLAELRKVRDRWEPGADGVDEDWLASFVDWWNGAGAWAALAPKTREAFRAAGWKLFREVVTLAADRTDGASWSRITVPTLLLGGARSPHPERRVIEKLAAAIPGATLHILPDAGHMGPLTHADEVNAAIRRLIERA